MLFKLSLRNVKRSIKDYMIYFVTLIIGVSLFYMFNSIEGQDAVKNISKANEIVMDMLTDVLGYVSILVACILAFLILFANRFLIKRRNKEFAVYLTLGMSKNKISFLLFYETVLIGIVSMFVGIILGILLAQLMGVLLIKLFEADMSDFIFTFSLAATKKTIIYFSIMYLAVMVFNVFQIGKCKLITLLTAGKKNESIKQKNTFITIVAFIVSISMLIFAYKWVLGEDTIGNLGKAVLFGCIGTFLFFWSVAGFLIKVLMSIKRVYLKSLNCFVVRQLSSKINTEVMSLTVICIILFLTICAMSTCLSLNSSMNKDLKELTPIDFQLVKSHIPYGDEEEISEYINYTAEEELSMLYFEPNKYFEQSINTNVYNVKDITLLNTCGSEANDRLGIFYRDGYEDVIKLTDYNNIARMLKTEEIYLQDNEYAIIANSDVAMEVRNEGLKEIKQLNIQGNILNLKNDTCIEGFRVMSTSRGNQGFVIVPDYIVDNYTYRLAHSIYSGNYRASSEEEFKQIEESMERELKGLDLTTTHYVSKTGLRAGAVGIGAMITFVGLYLGIIFLVSCVAILAIKSLSEITDNKQRYSVLRKIGADEKEISAALFKQIGVSFLLPLLLACVHSYFGIKLSKDVLKFFGTKDVGSIIITVLIITLIYGGYFVVTYISSKNIIAENKSAPHA